MEVGAEDMNILVENASPVPLYGGAHAVEKVGEEDMRALVVGKANEATRVPGSQVAMNTGRICSYLVTEFEGVPNFG